MKNILFYSLLSICFISENASGQTWNQIPSGTSKDLFTINFPTSAVGYIGGQDSLILKTVDGGASWQALDMSNFPFAANEFDVIDLQFVTDSIGYAVVGPYTGTYKTIDGGTTWTVVDQIYLCYNSAIYLFDEDNGFLGGSGCFSGDIINKQVNGVWEETNITPQFGGFPYGRINNFDFWDDSLGIASSLGDYFFRTTNGGTTWDTIPNTLDPADSMTSVLFISSDTVLATFTHSTTSEFGVLISFDGGLTWQIEMNSATFFYPNMHAMERAGNGHIYIGGYYSSGPGNNLGIIYESNGSINTFWNSESVTESINGIDSYGDSIVFAVGDNGYIIVNQDVSTLSIQETVDNFEFEIYPNPNKGQFSVESDNQEIEDLTIYNAQGQLVSNMKIQFIEKNKWFVEELNSGIYHVKISVQGRNYTKKVVIF